MDSKSQHKGKAISTSAPSFSFRYNAEDEEVEQVYTPTSDSETSRADDNLSKSSPAASKEEVIPRADSSPKLRKAGKRSASLEDGGSPEPTWRLFTEIRGRITKTVEEKIEEIKSDRRKSKKNKKLLSNSSLSDSEERSEASSSLKETSEVLEAAGGREGGSSSQHHPPPPESGGGGEGRMTADSDLGDISDVSGTPERASTPIGGGTEPDLSGTTTPSVGATPTSTLLQCPPLTPSSSDKTMHTPYKKTKTKSRGKIEVGVEAVEESLGREEGRITKTGEAKRPSLEPGKQSQQFQTSISLRAALYIALLGVLYTFVNIPQFVFGVILGVFLSFEFSIWAESCFQWFNGHHSDTSDKSLRIPGSDTFSAAPSQTSTSTYEGWINEFCFEYQPEIYHVTQTETVYIRLEGTILKLASPRQKIPKRAIWNEPSYKLRFDRERTYDISNCQVVLLPDKLTHKRIWSKKYPICIILKPDSHLGTRYRERGTPSLELVSFKGRRKSIDKERSSEKDAPDSPKEEEPNKDSGLSENEGEVVFYSEDEDEEDALSGDYVKVPTSIVNKGNIYLFARTDREKDLWFRRLLVAVKMKSNDNKCEQTSESSDDFEGVDSPAQLCHAAMTKLIGRKVSYQGTEDSLDITDEDDELAWFNLFLGRIFFDPMHDPFWIKQIQEKIQRKLSAIKVPPFMEELLVSQVELTDSIPVIDRSGFPRMNEDGIWVDLDIVYKGTFKMAIDTKINIMKLKNSKLEDSELKAEGNESPESPERTISKPAIFDSDMEDTAESSDDSVDPDDPDGKASNSRNTSHKVLQMVDKIASSKYFQQVTDNKFVKKALEGVSNTTISLLVEVKSLVGTVVLNFPPPPSDRLWYGFRPNTKLTLSAKPRVGQRGINMAYITNYIEKKLLREFEKLLVIPNMDDLIIPVMNKSKPS